MADTRVRIPKDKADLVRALKEGSDSNGPFQTYADVIAYAAALGAQQGKRSPLDEISSNPDPIPKEHFISRKYEALIHLLSVASTQDPKSLAGNEDIEVQQIRVFEEYANAGLDILNSKLNGVVDYSESLLLLASK
ncbi:DNA phosphorothioation-associated protein 4 [Lyngbya confervoides]|uniref:DNA phosphorothioation-associated protein 4 n=1 Tax=Lyngbya confervoides BDU141951 TaxID=1574623 RepID=A0ABD4T109_9CYAN|nr:DNA phosphorothioation-associated protein 4 [Lyngbya confervoides]MCM1981987.1 DNA phosphorothioation-associated protein 4 [Lyngbya confervoides BDU141951]